MVPDYSEQKIVSSAIISGDYSPDPEGSRDLARTIHVDVRLQEYGTRSI